MLQSDELMHYGVARRSGRYPWGSGDEPYQRSGDFLARINDLKSHGLNDTDIAKTVGLTTTQLRTQRALAVDERRMLDVATAKSLKADGLGNSEIGRRMGKPESSIRSLLNAESERKMNSAKETSDFLKDQIDKKGIIDVGAGVEREMNISKEKMVQALYALQLKGYNVYGIGVQQVSNPTQQTIMKVACPPDVTYHDAYVELKKGNVGTVKDYYSPDEGKTFVKNAPKYPSSISSDRVSIRYAEEGGKDMDGVIQIRRNVPDLSLGSSTYAQVRIMVDGTHYLKGMAIYSDKIPEGKDIIFNTNKEKGTPLKKVLKEIKKDDPDNPFGATIKLNGQSTYTGKDGKQHLSAINKIKEEYDWNNYNNSIVSSQFLSKQSIQMIKKQLNITMADKDATYDEICSYTNPTVKKYLLSKFADKCDSDAAKLEAASLPRQKWHVILPVPTLKDNEIYAPNYRDGEKLALVRYPHGGTFEIPICVVNNKQKDAKSVLGNVVDAVGINSHTAERLSGADFDGDTVLCIPTGKKVKVTTTSPLEGLKDFDPKTEYAYHDGIRILGKTQTQTEMGKVSNLITDMTLKGANEDELARAVRHSMVIIDANKHQLDYKQSEIDNNISELKKHYQGRIDEDGQYHEGASTLLSRANADVAVTKRKGSPRIDKETGEKTYKESIEEFTDPKTGKIRTRTQNSKMMLETDDAKSLSSGTLQEEAYAEYANHMKALGNKARKEMMSTGKIQYSPSAKEAYDPEVKSLLAKLNIALKNAPRERQAQVIANATAAAKKNSNPDMTNKEYKKIKDRELIKARLMVGANGKDTKIQITDREWEAIQAGAISESRLYSILSKADSTRVTELAMPRATTTLSEAKINKIKAMSATYTVSEMADAMGVSTSTISKYLKE